MHTDTGNKCILQTWDLWQSVRLLCKIQLIPKWLKWHSGDDCLLIVIWGGKSSTLQSEISF